jgi:acetyltransferase-like isoleucine patch superfamily enzyme
MNRDKLYLKFRIRTFVAGIIQSFRVRLARFRGFDIHPTVILERKLHLDRLYPAGVHIDEHCLIASGVTILSHDHCKRVDGHPFLLDTYIGKRCFIAVNATILPGVHIGDEVIVGAGAVVAKNVPSNVIVAGNPATIIREHIRMNDSAELTNWQNGKWTE